MHRVHGVPVPHASVDAERGNHTKFGRASSQVSNSNFTSRLGDKNNSENNARQPSPRGTLSYDTLASG
jgi:hypothetical protein